MRVQAICHAAFLCESEGTTLLVDPWLRGTVFMGGWALCPEPLNSVLSDLPAIQYIYLTHEHPDHFHPASLKGLLEGPARNATLLIPRFMTPRFVARLRRTFPQVTVRELPHGAQTEFGALKVWSYQYRIDDSTLVVQDRAGFTLVNSNDSFVKGRARQQIARRHPEPDLLLNQFSVSNAYPYGYADFDRSDAFPWQKKDLAEYCVELIEVLRPRSWVPYHSFVAFCRPENQYLNEGRTTLDEICEYVGRRAGESVVRPMYPGDVWDSGVYKQHPHGQAHFDKWEARIAKPVGETTSEQLREAARTFERDFKTVSKLFRRRVRPCGFTVTEDEQCLLFDPMLSAFTFGDLRLRTTHSDLGWTTTSRELLVRALSVPWGMADLLISGCMVTQVPKEHRARDFNFWAIALMRHTGYLNLSSLWWLRPRAISTALRRRAEALDIIGGAVRTGNFVTGNIAPRKLAE